MHAGKTLISDKQKACAFCGEYANVSRLPRDPRKDETVKKTKSQLIQHCNACNDERTGMCSKFTLEELNFALQRLPTGKAAGKDTITNEMLMQLSDKALLNICNISWLQHTTPGDWKHATIIPVPKKGKPLNKLGSFRPISLTSCAAKLCKRLVKARLQYWVESNNILTNYQSGFRPNRSTEDQVLRITQLAEDGLRHKERKRSILVLIDFSRAFDKVWREGLYTKALQLGAPPCLVKWLQAFLTDRKANVRFGNSTSEYLPFKEGCPQGAVLSPDMFLIFINDLATKLTEDHPNIHISLFADDLALLSQDRSIDTATREMQRALDTLTNWATEWKMKIAPEKCETLLITLDLAQAKTKPAVCQLSHSTLTPNSSV